jgi:hypothetical protein
MKWTKSENKKDWELHNELGLLARVIQEKSCPDVYRANMPDGYVSDILNLTRARSAAIALARDSRRPIPHKPGFGEVKRESIRILVKPMNLHGLFEAILEENSMSLCRSHQPLLDSARILIKMGYDPKSTIVMSQAGKPASLMAELGLAAKIRVDETTTTFKPFVEFDSAKRDKLNARGG